MAEIFYKFKSGVVADTKDLPLEYGAIVYSIVDGGLRICNGEQWWPFGSGGNGIDIGENIHLFEEIEQEPIADDSDQELEYGSQVIKAKGDKIKVVARKIEIPAGIFQVDVMANVRIWPGTDGRFIARAKEAGEKIVDARFENDNAEKITMPICMSFTVLNPLELEKLVLRCRLKPGSKIKILDMTTCIYQIGTA